MWIPPSIAAALFICSCLLPSLVTSANMVFTSTLATPVDNHIMDYENLARRFVCATRNTTLPPDYAKVVSIDAENRVIFRPAPDSHQTTFYVLTPTFDTTQNWTFYADFTAGAMPTEDNNNRAFPMVNASVDNGRSNLSVGSCKRLIEMMTSSSRKCHFDDKENVTCSSTSKTANCTSQFELRCNITRDIWKIKKSGELLSDYYLTTASIKLYNDALYEGQPCKWRAKAVPDYRLLLEKNSTGNFSSSKNNATDEQLVLCFKRSTVEKPDEDKPDQKKKGSCLTKWPFLLIASVAVLFSVLLVSLGIFTCVRRSKLKKAAAAKQKKDEADKKRDKFGGAVNAEEEDADRVWALAKNKSRMHAKPHTSVIYTTGLNINVDDASGRDLPPEDEDGIAVVDDAGQDHTFSDDQLAPRASVGIGDAELSMLSCEDQQLMGGIETRREEMEKRKRYLTPPVEPMPGSLDSDDAKKAKDEYERIMRTGQDNRNNDNVYDIVG